MKARKTIAILLCVLLLVSLLPTLPVVSAAGVNGYYNVDYLESEAAAAYNEQGLGADYTPSATTWKVWSPTAKRVQLRLYSTGSDDEEGAKVIGTFTMKLDKQTGVWSLKLNGDFKNVYYTYLVTVRGVTNETRDIYAKAAGVNGYRSMVVDLDATDPAGWNNDKHVLLDESTDAVIWEIHVRDFSVDPSSGVTDANRGKYLAFTEANTTLPGTDVSTCVNYLKEMGVNTVHLLPVYDFGSVDETVTDDPTNRNWGYDPINYNVPEGSYSTDPYNGNTRITEFKEMVQALHKAGISVVMDVVYNHTYDVDSYEWGARLLYNNAFNDTVPGYYHRRSDPTNWYNGSGCGNVTSSDKLMYRKYMIESVHYWATEYHIDGFRFDLMGCHDVETMNLIRADLDALDGGEKILMYGEPWTGGNAGIANGATQNGAQNFKMNERIGMFCDWMRDAIKGNPDGDTKGWIQGETAGNQTDTVWGGLNANDGRFTAKSQTVTYADAHDNLILWDKIVKSNGGSVFNDYTSESAQKNLKQLRLAETITMMSQGMQFQVGGTEFARNKKGNHNSYNAPDDVNAIDWNVRKTNSASADFYKGLIAIRKAFSPITDPVREYTKNSMEGADDNCIAYWIPNDTAGEWGKLAVILNNSDGDKTVTLPEGNWTVVSNGTEADPAGLGSASGSYTVPGFTGAILVQGTESKNAIRPTPKSESADKDYYLVGSINGEDVGDRENYAETGNYHFVNGKVTLETTAESYVFVKTADNAHWYMTNGWQGFDATSVTLYDTAVHELGEEADKLYVPSGVTATFTLVEGENDTLTLSYSIGEEPDPGELSSYYLVGSMSDWSPDPAYQMSAGSNDGEYVLRNVKLEEGTALKVVMVDENNNQHWYPDGMGNDYVVTNNGVYEVSFYPAGGKPKDEYHEGYFKLTKTGEYDPDPVEVSYYLIGEFCGWEVDEAYKLTAGENEGEFVFKGVTLYASGGIKVKSSKNTWYPSGTGNDYIVPENGLYDVSFYPAGGVQGYHEGFFQLTKVGDITPEYPDPMDHTGANDKMILHCWNWSYDTIREYLPQIKAAGYTAVQTSPAQPHSGFRTGTVGTGDWWMLYQPLGLHIAQENQSWLGSEAQLTALCTAAHDLGIEVIVDVVSNHICNAYNDIAQYDANGNLIYDPKCDAEKIQGTNGYRFETIPDSHVADFNPELFTESPTKYFREYINCNDEETENVVRGNIGMPDFKTEESVVQQSVLTYLKELIDAGVDGFRFDAAKHIETPDDGAYSSQFWPVIIHGAEEYAAAKGKTVWSYGEVLSTAGKTRKMNSYAPYIDMTEISYAYTITVAFGDHKGANSVASQLFKDWLGVGTETLKNSDLVLMAESHDMYAQDRGSFSRYNSEVINKAWAVAAARADCSALYFARPKDYVYGLNASDPEAGYPVGTLGECENFDWMDLEVAEANKFHTAFVGAEEFVSASGNYVVIERWNEEDSGIVLVNAEGGASSVNATVSYVNSGEYYDQITGNLFTVSGGKVSGSMGACGIAVLRSTAPKACEHPADQRSERTVEATCTQDGYIAVYCNECGRMVEYTMLPALGHVDKDKDEYCDRCGESLKFVTVYFVDAEDWIHEHDCYNNVHVYAYDDAGNNNAAWPGVKMEQIGRTTDNHGIWKAEVNREKYSKIIFNDNGGESTRQTDSLSFLEDANDAYIVIYQANSGSATGVKTLTDLKEVCDHTAYEIVGKNGVEYKVCDCCGESTKLTAYYPFMDVVGGKYYYKSVYWAFEHDPQITGGKTDTTFGVGSPCTREQIVTFLWKAYDAVEPTDTSNPFTDVKDSKYYFKPVMWAKEKGITGGVSSSLFGVGQPCKREQAVTFLWKAAGSPTPKTTKSPFTDVPNGKYYYKAVLWAYENNITGGVSKTEFGVGRTCTREQIVTFLYKACTLNN
ncbi:MAG: type I pullulanase [Oscillospiraceae bacterium]|nr:type I pullulanase [Oscillospiraceae bacterium]